MELRPRKSLGQNFLVDSRIARRIVDSVNPGPNDLIIEIGPGLGALTLPLTASAGAVVGVEIDPLLCERLRSTIAAPNFDLVHEDALTVDWKKLLARFRRGLDRSRIVANLPYNISTPLIERLMDVSSELFDLTLMLQAEVVERLVSGPGSRQYGYMSVFVQYHCDVQKLFDVPPAAFRPVPKVWSSVLRLAPRREKAILVDEERFFSLVRHAFSQRRKTLFNNLKSHPAVGHEREWLKAAFDRASIDPTRRAETLSMEEFGDLYRSILEC